MKLTADVILSIFFIISGLFIIRFPEKFNTYIITIVVGILVVLEVLKSLYESRK